MQDTHEICTRHKSTYKQYIHIHTTYGLTPLLYMYVCCMYCKTIHTHTALIHAKYIRTKFCRHLHAYACICMYLPVYSWLPAATHDASSGASSGNTAGGQHHRDCPCGSSPRSAHSISNEMVIIFIFSSATLVTAGESVGQPPDHGPDHGLVQYPVKIVDTWTYTVTHKNIVHTMIYT